MTDTTAGGKVTPHARRQWLIRCWLAKATPEEIPWLLDDLRRDDDRALRRRWLVGSAVPFVAVAAVVLELVVLLRDPPAWPVLWDKGYLVWPAVLLTYWSVVCLIGTRREFYPVRHRVLELHGRNRDGTPNPLPPRFARRTPREWAVRQLLVAVVVVAALTGGLLFSLRPWRVEVTACTASPETLHASATVHHEGPPHEQPSLEWVDLATGEVLASQEVTPTEGRFTPFPLANPDGRAPERVGCRVTR